MPASLEEDERVGPSREKLSPPWVAQGRDLSRLLALSDGIFAFAMTLLVLGLALPVGLDPKRVGQVRSTCARRFLPTS